MYPLHSQTLHGTIPGKYNSKARIDILRGSVATRLKGTEIFNNHSISKHEEIDRDKVTPKLHYFDLLRIRWTTSRTIGPLLTSYRTS